MNRMDAAFAAMLEKGEKILVSYFPVGDSCVADAVAWAGKFLENGTTVLELGLPYENPVMDGAVVRESMERALRRTDLTGAFADISDIRKAYPNALLQAMTYVENVLKYGCERFADICAECGVDAVLAANADPRQLAELDKALGRYDIRNLRFIPYRMTEENIADLLKNPGGYVYLQAVDGATGSSSEITDQAGENAARLRSAGVTAPLIPGFGISTPEHIKAYLAMGVDGVIVGSAIIKHILNGTGEEYIKSLSDALRCPQTKCLTPGGVTIKHDQNQKEKGE